MGKLLVLIEEINSFKLETAVCNHGFFMMAPNLWLPSQKSLIRPLRLIEFEESIIVSISQPLHNFLQIELINTDPSSLSIEDRQAIRTQVGRMLRISVRDETQLNEFHEIHPQAKTKGFGRIFRSPNLFEDIVKSVLLCNCPWSRSLEMAQALCDLQYKLFSKKKCRTKRKRCNNTKNGDLETISTVRGSFPSPKELAGLDETTLNRHCNLGYRAELVINIARNVVNGTLNLKDLEFEWEDDHLNQDQLFRRLMGIKGFGPFTASNLMMCLGFYQHIPVDTETIKHLQEVHGQTKLAKENQVGIIDQIYGKYAPFQCLAYWFERVEYYEKRLGKLSELPHSKYPDVATNKI